MEEKIMVTGVKGMYCRQCPELILGDVLQTRGVLDASVPCLPRRRTGHESYT